MNNINFMNVIKKKIAFVFPGQGSQKVGMGYDLYLEHKAAKEVFQSVDETLKRNLSKIIFHGENEQLTKTYNTQPALMAVSIALVRVLEYELKKNFYEIASIVSGHSLGEYSALCSINVLSLEDASRLLEIRGKSMQSAVKNEETQMTAVLGVKIQTVEEIINKNIDSGICDIANDNCPGQIVLSGHKSKLKNILDTSDEPLVSSDFNHNSHSAIVDLSLTKVIENKMAKVSAWYDNEWGFASRICDLANYFGKI